MSVELESVFLNLLGISAASAVVILAVVLLSSIINRSFTAKWKYWLWMVLAIRLLIPLDLSFDAAPAKVEVKIPYNAEITLPAPAAVPASPVQTAGPVVTIGMSEPVTTTETVHMVDLLISAWLAGAAVFILWQLVSYLRFRRRVERWGLPIERDSVAATVRQQVEAEFGIRGTIPALIYDQVSSPMMIGFFCPLLILPQEEYSAQSLSYILRHELTHYQRRDIWYKMLLLLANAVHWFNPAVWLMVREASRDLEISCDAAVMKNADMDQRRAYSEIILSCVHQELKMKTSLSTHFYGGKKALKERFANILSTKKRRAGVIAFAVVLLCGALAGGMVAFRAVNGRSRENTVRAALIGLFAVTVDEAEEFYALPVPTPVPGEGPGITSAPHDISRFFDRLWGNAMTEDCIQRLVADRVFTRIADYVLETGRDIRVKGFNDMDLSKRADGENLYDYTARISSGDEIAAQAFGTIQVEWVDDYSTWKASYITVTIEFIDRIPLEGWSYISSFSDPLPQEQEHPQLVCKDDTAARLARAISPLDWFISTAEPPSFDASHPLDTELAARVAFDNTRRLDWLSFNDYPDHPIVKRVDRLREEEPVICDIIYADDAAAALKRLFGVTDWEHHTVEYYNYFPEEGVYITYAELIRGVVYPQLLSWERTANGYSCEVVPVSARSNSIDGVEVTEENIAELAQRARHYVFTFDMTSGEPVVTGFAEGTLQTQPLPQSITLREWTPFGTELWGLLIDDPEELRLVAGLLSTRYLTPSSPDDTNWTDGGVPISFELDYGDHTVTGACNPNEARAWSDTIPASFDIEGHTSIVTSEDEIVYHYPNAIGVQLLAFLDSKGFDMGSWWKDYIARSVAFQMALENVDGAAVGGFMDFTLQMPASWTVSTHNDIYDGNGLLTAEVIPWIWDTGGTAFDRLAERYPDAELVDASIGELTGKRFTVQTPVEGMTAVNNEIYYYLRWSDYLIGIKFHPKAGIGGIQPQREAFESKVRIVPSATPITSAPEPDHVNPPDAEEINPDFGPYDNPDTSQMYSEEQNAAWQREFAFYGEVYDGFPQLPKESYSYYTTYGEGSGNDMQLVLEIGVIDEAAVDNFLASWTGMKWDKLVKTPGTVSQAEQEAFCEKVEQLDLGPNVYIYSRPEAGLYNTEVGKILVSISLDLYASQEEVARWQEMPQAIKDFAAENGIPENMLGYMAPRYTPPGSNPDT